MNIFTRIQTIYQSALPVTFTNTCCPEGRQVHITDCWHWHMTVSLPLLQDCTIHLRARPASASLFHTTAKAAAIKQKSLKTIQFRPQAEQLLPVHISLHIQSDSGFSKVSHQLAVKSCSYCWEQTLNSITEIKATVLTMKEASMHYCTKSTTR